VGIFSGIGKLVGKVAKFAASRATGGASDALLSVLKSRGQRPRDLEKMSPAKRDALIAKLGPEVAPTLSRQRTVYNAALADDGMMGSYGPGEKRARKYLSDRRSAEAKDRAIRMSQGTDEQVVDAGWRVLQSIGKKKKKKAKAAPRAPAARVSSRGGAKRRAPTGGLDLKAISVAWNKAGKPGRWIDFVKAQAK